MDSYPVWFNRQGGGVDLYAVVICRLDGRKRLYLVLTGKGPVFAKEVAEQEGKGPAIKSERVVIPLVCPHIREVEHVLNNTSRIGRVSPLRLYRFAVDNPGGTASLFVWTHRSHQQAGAFAQRSIPGGKVTSWPVVTSPLIVAELGDFEKALASG